MADYAELIRRPLVPRLPSGVMDVEYFDRIAHDTIKDLVGIASEWHHGERPDDWTFGAHSPATAQCEQRYAGCVARRQALSLDSESRASRRS